LKIDCSEYPPTSLDAMEEYGFGLLGSLRIAKIGILVSSLLYCVILFFNLVIMEFEKGWYTMFGVAFLNQWTSTITCKNGPCPNGKHPKYLSPSVYLNQHSTTSNPFSSFLITSFIKIF
jgi:hypothetical protein